MNQLETLTYAVGELRGVVAALHDAELELASNCDPWTVRRLATHAVKNQLFWAGLVTGTNLMPLDESMGAVPYDGDLAPFAEKTFDRVLELWDTSGVLEATHATPFGSLPGSAVVNFPIIDAIAHAWDVSTSVGRPIEFTIESIPAISAVVEFT
ncbi:MAG: maleylpyruvate isomerase N-terminal domain-containing protein, partial [Actinomycetota bacterium]